MAYKMKNPGLAKMCRSAAAGSSPAKFLRKKPKASYKSGVPIVEGTKAARQAEREERRDLRKSLRKDRKQLKRMGGDLERQEKFKADKAAYEAKKNSPAKLKQPAAKPTPPSPPNNRRLNKGDKSVTKDQQRVHNRKLRDAKKIALKEEKQKYKQAKKEIKSYTDY